MFPKCTDRTTSVGHHVSMGVVVMMVMVVSTVRVVAIATHDRAKRAATSPSLLELDKSAPADIAARCRRCDARNRSSRLNTVRSRADFVETGRLARVNILGVLRLVIATIFLG